MMQFDFITLFPEIFEQHFNILPFKRALSKNLVKINLWNLRNYAIDPRGTVDDKPFGGGVGMILRIEPIYKALCDIYKTQDFKPSGKKIVLLSPKGKTYNQNMATQLVGETQITLICGRYEGFDARIESLVTDIISIGDFVLSGGELPALTITESILRLIPGVIENEEALKDESFTNNSLEYPQYTRPREFNGMTVPEVLISGNHKEIEEWKKGQATILDPKGH